MRKMKPESKDLPIVSVPLTWTRFASSGIIHVLTSKLPGHTVGLQFPESGKPRTKETPTPTE